MFSIDYRRLDAWLPPALLGALLTFFIYTGWVGVDFGNHWDEFIHHDHVVNTLRDGIILPYKCENNFCYVYPSFTYLLSLIVTTLNLFFHGGIAYLRETVEAGYSLDAFRMAVRPVFIVICSLMGLWLFLAQSKQDKIAAIVSAAIPLLSWEYAYHARWIAPDAVMAQFCALWLFGIMRAEKSPNRKAWLIFSVVAAGLVTATKYTGGSLFFATLLFAWLLESGSISGLRVRTFPWRLSLDLFVVFLAVFLIITPGAVLQPATFFRDVRADLLHYSSGHLPAWGVISNDVHGGLTYALKLWEYVALALFSPMAWLSFLLFALAPVGAYALWKEGRYALVGTIVFLLLFYSFFFSARTVVFIVRNYLFFLPLIAVLIGCGFSAVLRFSRKAQWISIAVLLGIGAANAYSLETAALSISRYNKADLIQSLGDYIRSQPDRKFAVSQSLGTALGAVRLPNIAPAAEADAFAYWHSDLGPQDQPKLSSYPGTELNTFAWIGPREVNYNYYPTWDGRDRIVIVTIQQARDMGLTRAIPAF